MIQVQSLDADQPAAWQTGGVLARAVFFIRFDEFVRPQFREPALPH